MQESHRRGVQPSHTVGAPLVAPPSNPPKAAASRSTFSAAASTLAPSPLGGGFSRGSEFSAAGRPWISMHPMLGRPGGNAYSQQQQHSQVIINPTLISHLQREQQQQRLRPHTKPEEGSAPQQQRADAAPLSFHEIRRDGNGQPLSHAHPWRPPVVNTAVVSAAHPSPRRMPLGGSSTPRSGGRSRHSPPAASAPRSGVSTTPRVRDDERTAAKRGQSPYQHQQTATGNPLTAVHHGQFQGVTQGVDVAERVSLRSSPARAIFKDERQEQQRYGLPSGYLSPSDAAGRRVLSTAVPIKPSATSPTISPRRPHNDGLNRGDVQSRSTSIRKSPLRPLGSGAEPVATAAHASIISARPESISQWQLSDFRSDAVAKCCGPGVCKPEGGNRQRTPRGEQQQLQTRGNAFQGKTSAGGGKSSKVSSAVRRALYHSEPPPATRAQKIQDRKPAGGGPSARTSETVKVGGVGGNVFPRGSGGAATDRQHTKRSGASPHGGKGLSTTVARNVRYHQHMVAETDVNVVEVTPRGGRAKPAVPKVNDDQTHRHRERSPRVVTNTARERGSFSARDGRQLTPRGGGGAPIAAERGTQEAPDGGMANFLSTFASSATPADGPSPPGRVTSPTPATAAKGSTPRGGAREAANDSGGAPTKRNPLHQDRQRVYSTGDGRRRSERSRTGKASPRRIANAAANTKRSTSAGRRQAATTARSPKATRSKTPPVAKRFPSPFAVSLTGNEIAGPVAYLAASPDHERTYPWLPDNAAIPRRRHRQPPPSEMLGSSIGKPPPSSVRTITTTTGGAAATGGWPTTVAPIADRLRAPGNATNSSSTVLISSPEKQGNWPQPLPERRRFLSPQTSDCQPASVVLTPTATRSLSPPRQTPIAGIPGSFGASGALSARTGPTALPFVSPATTTTATGVSVLASAAQQQRGLTSSRSVPANNSMPTPAAAQQQMPQLHAAAPHPFQTSSLAPSLSPRNLHLTPSTAAPFAPPVPRLPLVASLHGAAGTPQQKTALSSSITQRPPSLSPRVPPPILPGSSSLQPRQSIGKTQAPQGLARPTVPIDSAAFPKTFGFPPNSSSSRHLPPAEHALHQQRQTLGAEEPNAAPHRPAWQHRHSLASLHPTPSLLGGGPGRPMRSPAVNSRPLISSSRRMSASIPQFPERQQVPLPPQMNLSPRLSALRGDLNMPTASALKRPTASTDDTSKRILPQFADSPWGVPSPAVSAILSPRVDQSFHVSTALPRSAVSPFPSEPPRVGAAAHRASLPQHRFSNVGTRPLQSQHPPQSTATVQTPAWANQPSLQNPAVRVGPAPPSVPRLRLPPGGVGGALPPPSSSGHPPPNSLYHNQVVLDFSFDAAVMSTMNSHQSAVSYNDPLTNFYTNSNLSQPILPPKAAAEEDSTSSRSSSSSTEHSYDDGQGSSSSSSSSGETSSSGSSGEPSSSSSSSTNSSSEVSSAAQKTASVADLKNVQNIQHVQQHPPGGRIPDGAPPAAAAPLAAPAVNVQRIPPPTISDGSGLQSVVNTLPLDDDVDAVLLAPSVENLPAIVDAGEVREMVTTADSTIDLVGAFHPVVRERAEGGGTSGEGEAVAAKSSAAIDDRTIDSGKADPGPSAVEVAVDTGRGQFNENDYDQSAGEHDDSGEVNDAEAVAYCGSIDTSYAMASDGDYPQFDDDSLEADVTGNALAVRKQAGPRDDGEEPQRHRCDSATVRIHEDVRTAISVAEVKHSESEGSQITEAAAVIWSGGPNAFEGVERRTVQEARDGALSYPCNDVDENIVQPEAERQTVHGRGHLVQRSSVQEFPPGAAGGEPRSSAAEEASECGEVEIGRGYPDDEFVGRRQLLGNADDFDSAHQRQREEIVKGATDENFWKRSTVATEERKPILSRGFTEELTVCIGIFGDSPQNLGSSGAAKRLGDERDTIQSAIAVSARRQISPELPLPSTQNRQEEGDQADVGGNMNEEIVIATVVSPSGGSHLSESKLQSSPPFISEDQDRAARRSSSSTWKSPASGPRSGEERTLSEGRESRDGSVVQPPPSEAAAEVRLQLAEMVSAALTEDKMSRSEVTGSYLEQVNRRSGGLHLPSEVSDIEASDDSLKKQLVAMGVGGDHGSRFREHHASVTTPTFSPHSSGRQSGEPNNSETAIGNSSGVLQIPPDLPDEYQEASSQGLPSSSRIQRADAASDDRQESSIASPNLTDSSKEEGQPLPTAANFYESLGQVCSVTADALSQEWLVAGTAAANSTIKQRKRRRTPVNSTRGQEGDPEKRSAHAATAVGSPVAVGGSGRESAGEVEDLAQGGVLDDQVRRYGEVAGKEGSSSQGSSAQYRRGFAEMETTEVSDEVDHGMHESGKVASTAAEVAGGGRIGVGDGIQTIGGQNEVVHTDPSSGFLEIVQGDTRGSSPEKQTASWGSDRGGSQSDQKLPSDSSEAAQPSTGTPEKSPRIKRQMMRPQLITDDSSGERENEKGGSELSSGIDGADGTPMTVHDCQAVEPASSERGKADDGVQRIEDHKVGGVTEESYEEREFSGRERVEWGEDGQDEADDVVLGETSKEQADGWSASERKSEDGRDSARRRQEEEDSAASGWWSSGGGLDGNVVGEQMTGMGAVAEEEDDDDDDDRGNLFYFEDEFACLKDAFEDSGSDDALEDLLVAAPLPRIPRNSPPPLEVVKAYADRMVTSLFVIEAAKTALSFYFAWGTLVTSCFFRRGFRVERFRHLVASHMIAHSFPEAAKAIQNNERNVASGLVGQASEEVSENGGSSGVEHLGGGGIQQPAPVLEMLTNYLVAAAEASRRKAHDLEKFKYGVEAVFQILHNVLWGACSLGIKLRIAKQRQLMRAIGFVVTDPNFPRLNMNGTREFTFKVLDQEADFDVEEGGGSATAAFPYRKWDRLLHALDCFALGCFPGEILRDPQLSARLHSGLAAAASSAVACLAEPTESGAAGNKGGGREEGGEERSAMSSPSAGDKRSRALAGVQNDARILVNVLVANGDFREATCSQRVLSESVIRILLAHAAALACEFAELPNGVNDSGSDDGTGSRGGKRRSDEDVENGNRRDKSSEEIGVAGEEGSDDGVPRGKIDEEKTTLNGNELLAQAAVVTEGLAPARGATQGGTLGSEAYSKARLDSTNLLIGMYHLTGGQAGRASLHEFRVAIFKFAERMRLHCEEELRTPWLAEALQIVVSVAKSGGSPTEVSEGDHVKGGGTSSVANFELLMSCSYCESLIVGVDNILPCQLCGLCGYCQESCLASDWDEVHKDMCPSLAGSVWEAEDGSLSLSAASSAAGAKPAEGDGEEKHRAEIDERRAAA